MPTYKKIAEFVRQTYGVCVKTCHIACVKSQHELTTRKAHNRRSADSVRYPCPDALRPKIEHALRHFGVKLV